VDVAAFVISLAAFVLGLVSLIWVIALTAARARDKKAKPK
jgi:hypothetical protein